MAQRKRQFHANLEEDNTLKTLPRKILGIELGRKPGPAAHLLTAVESALSQQPRYDRMYVEEIRHLIEMRDGRGDGRGGGRRGRGGPPMAAFISGMLGGGYGGQGPYGGGAQYGGGGYYRGGDYEEDAFADSPEYDSAVMMRGGVLQLPAEHKSFPFGLPAPLRVRPFLLVPCSAS